MELGFDPFSSLLNFSTTGNVTQMRETVETFKNFVRKSGISHHAVHKLRCFCQCRSKNALDFDFDMEEECIVPIINFFLQDKNQVVSQIAFKHLGLLVCKGMISKNPLENHFCSSLAQSLNTHAFSVSSRLQTMNIIFQIISWVDKEVVAKEIMPEISKLCLDPNIDQPLKTACVTRFEKLARKLERDLTEKHIIPLYQIMANEELKIRKNCVEVSVALSFICSKEIRDAILVPIFISFLNDPHKYISDLALIAVGPFIASFADCEQSPHHKTLNEVLVDNIYNFNYGRCKIILNMGGLPTESDYDTFCAVDEFSEFQMRSKYRKIRSAGFNAVGFTEKSEISTETSPITEIDDSDESEVVVKDEFNSFNYWREPLVNIEDELFGNKRTGINMNKNSISDEFDRFNVRISEFLDEDESNFRCLFKTGDWIVTKIYECFESLNETAVPKELLYFFIKNLLSNYCSNIYFAPIYCICAFSFPAVALTLGKENWPCLRVAFNALIGSFSDDIHFILASSLVDIAKIIGPEYTNSDILPAFFEFMKQSDDIREKLIKNLSSFVSILDKTKQNEILRRLPDLYNLSSEYNWRSRVEFVDQFSKIVKLYDTPAQFNKIILPMIFSLLQDRVSEVRKATIPLLSLTIQQLCDLSETNPAASKIKENILDHIHFMQDPRKKWSSRQLFIMVCENIVLNCVLPADLIQEKLLTPLLNLSKDKVTNVRLTLSRVISNKLFQKYFDETALAKIEDTIKELIADEDDDVRSFVIEKSEQSQESVLDLSGIENSDASSSETKVELLPTTNELMISDDQMSTPYDLNFKVPTGAREEWFFVRGISDMVDPYTDD